MLKTLVRAPLRTLGFDIVRRGVSADVLDTVGELLADVPNPVLLDVGANVGQTATRYAARFPRASVYSFEPDPAAFATLSQAVSGLKNVKVFNTALGDADETRSLRVNAESVTNSFLATAADENAVSQHGWYQPKHTVDVPVATLDSFATQHNIGHIHLLKLDVQGYEMKVLAGADRLLDKKAVKLLIAEVMFVKFYENQCYYDEIAGYLRAKGYKLVDLYDKDVHRVRGILQANALFMPADGGSA